MMTEEDVNKERQRGRAALGFSSRTKRPQLAFLAFIDRQGLALRIHSLLHKLRNLNKQKLIVNKNEVRIKILNTIFSQKLSTIKQIVNLKVFFFCKGTL